MVRRLSGGLLAGLLLAPAPAAAAVEPARSTATARAPRPPENPWALTYGLDRRGDRYGRLDYRLRWSFDDLSERASEPLRAPGAPLEETVRGLMQGMGVELYGVRLRPFRDLALSAPLPRAELAASTAAASGAAPAPARERWLRLYSWERLYEDLESSARRETERFIVREGFDRSLPAYRAKPYDQKKALGAGLLDWGRGALTDMPSTTK